MEHSLRLLVLDPDLASAIDDPARRQSALQNITAGRLDLVQGEQLDPRAIGDRAKFGILVLSGFLVRELTTSAGRVSADLIGPEDAVRLDSDTPEVAMLRHRVSWTALTDVRLALLDDGFFTRAAGWPEVSAQLFERTDRFGQRLALQGAIATLQSVDTRVLASFWTWASQWATVGGQGVVLRIPLSHERIARLVHARRPTITAAVGRLRNSRLIAQRKDGSWMLRGPRQSDESQEQWDGVGMPAVGEMLGSGLGVRKSGGANSRALAMRELRARLLEQRETLRAAVRRHDEMLARMRVESGRLAANGSRASLGHE